MKKTCWKMFRSLTFAIFIRLHDVFKKCINKMRKKKLNLLCLNVYLIWYLLRDKICVAFKRVDRTFRASNVKDRGMNSNIFQAQIWKKTLLNLWHTNSIRKESLEGHKKKVLHVLFSAFEIRFVNVNSMHIMGSFYHK